MTSAKKFSYFPLSSYNYAYSLKWVEISYFVDVIQRMMLMDFSSKSDRDIIVSYIETLSSRNALTYNERFPSGHSFVSCRTARVSKLIVRLNNLCHVPRNLPDDIFLHYFDRFSETLENLFSILDDDEIVFHTSKFEKFYNIEWK